MSLQFNVSQLLKNDVGQRRVYEFEAEEPLLLDDTRATDVHGRVKFTLTNFGIMADVQASGRLHLTCARCLEAFESPVDVSFTEEYRPTIDITTGMPSAAVQHSELAFEISCNHTIDLTEALRQHFLLAVEIIPVCREDCQGLCPTCGTNRNTDTCTCPPVTESSPFAALQGLLSEHTAE
jgi:uncharacterized protein